MNCSTCGTFLAEGMYICPQCGMPTTASSYDVGHDDPTTPASDARQQPPATNYRPTQSTPPPPPPPYPNSGPYESPSPYPYPQFPYDNRPPSDKAKKGLNVALMIGILLVLMVLIGGSLMLLFREQRGAQAIRQATGIAIVTAVPTATPDVTKNPYLPGTSDLIINDPMQDNSKGDEWNEVTLPVNGGGTDTCGFNNGAYHLTLQRAGIVCRADASPLTTLSNIAYEAQLTITRGDSSGLAFRINPVQKTGYIFAIGVTGDYAIDTYNFKVQVNNEFTTLRKGSNTAIKRGWNQTNLVAVVANGSTISAYVNNQLVDQVRDRTHSQGRIGIYGNSQTVGDVEAKDVRVWSI